MHALRIDDELWSAAMAKARSEKRTLTAVIADALAAYVAGPGKIDLIPLEPKKTARGRSAKTPAAEVLPAAKVTGTGPEHGCIVPPQRKRCPHPGTRVIGGYCKQCGVVVGPDGYLPARRQ